MFNMIAVLIFYYLESCYCTFKGWLQWYIVMLCTTYSITQFSLRSDRYLRKDRVFEESPDYESQRVEFGYLVRTIEKLRWWSSHQKSGSLAVVSQNKLCVDAPYSINTALIHWCAYKEGILQKDVVCCLFIEHAIKPMGLSSLKDTVPKKIWSKFKTYQNFKRT